MNIRVCQGSIYSKICAPHPGEKYEENNESCKRQEKEEEKEKRLMKIRFFLIFASNYVNFRKVLKRGKDILFPPRNKSGSTKRAWPMYKISYSYYTVNIFPPRYVRMLKGKEYHDFADSNKRSGRANRNMIKGEQISNWFILALTFTPPTNFRKFRD